MGLINLCPLYAVTRTVVYECWLLYDFGDKYEGIGRINPVNFITRFCITRAVTRRQIAHDSRTERTILLLTKYYVSEHFLYICLLVRAIGGHRHKI